MTRDDLANKIVDMVFDGASQEEIAKIVEYSKEVIDKEKKND